MADGSQQQSRRYSAFISYNYNARDTTFARWLHKRLETYRLPRKLLSGDRGATLNGGRLRPLFRDADEMTAAADLSQAIREAIAKSDFLIVVCSPDAARSKWVGLEIELFRALHGDRNILAALVDGKADTAFHPALLAGAHGPVQPLAADFRPGGPGRRLGILRLVGALAEVSLDELVHRDAQRRRRRYLASGVGAVAAIVTVAALSALALIARADAERRQTETTGLVEYMLTDMRKAMQRTGRLDQLAALNDGAMQYYRHQNLKRLSEAQLRQRAKLLQAMGEDDEKRGNLDAARESFEDAHRTTAALLAAKPDDPKRIFAHSQSEYWVGFINWRTGDGAKARRHFEAYAALAARLLQIDPHNDEWVMEAAYAHGNLGTLALRQAGDPARAQLHFKAALADKAKVASHRRDDPDAQNAVAESYAWLADSQRVQGDFRGALASREAQRRILAELLAKTPNDVGVQSDMIAYELALARIEAAQGALEAASKRLESAQRAALALASRDPDNEELAKQARMIELFRVRTWLSAPERTPHTRQALADVLGDCKPRSPSLADEEIGDFCAILRARTLAAAGDELGAQAVMAPVRRHATKRYDVLTAHWGLNLADEARLIEGEGKKGRL